jgi:ATP/maltotriose-dependent transcriptional regulator MalT/DNA-binding SARP family transcriptional activator
MVAERVLYAKLSPPQSPRHTLIRARVDALLRHALDYRLTLVHASTGYGKSTALANLATWEVPLYWYSASEGDADPQQFLAHLITAFRRSLSTHVNAPLAILHEAGSTRSALDSLLNALNEHMSGPALIVVDDYHLAASPDVGALTEHFLNFLPYNLHAIISTRYPPAWHELVMWQARGQVLEVKRDDLAFTLDEIGALFRETYGVALSSKDVEMLAGRTEGLPIALQLIWQEMRARPGRSLDALLAPGSGSLEILFAYLARSVLAAQPHPVHDFLLHTAVLRVLDVEACNAVTQRRDSDALLQHVRDWDLFLIALGDEHYRYHHLFHDFLRRQAAETDPGAVADRHRRAAAYYLQSGNADEAIYHLLQAGAHDEAAASIVQVGETLLRDGQLDTLANWIDALTPETVAANSHLVYFLGELARLRSRFDEALALYVQAERQARAANDRRGITRALYGQALVYLDTVRPTLAEESLQQVLRLTDHLDDRAAHARLLELLAENKLNMGKPEEAEALRIQARVLQEEGPSEDALSVRVKLRSGRLDEARAVLETWAEQERGQLHPPRAARETLMILSLIYSMQGRAEAALATAQEGIALGTALRSPFIIAVGKMRLGHACQMSGQLREAVRGYEEAMALGDQLAVPRTRVEALWGLTRAYGLSGDLDSARRAAGEAIEIGRRAGDMWIVALVQASLGASLVITRHDREAVQVLSDALAGFRACADTFGRAASRLWLALACWHLQQRERALAHFEDALELAREHHYDYLFTLTTLLGVQDVRMNVPLLLEARQRGRSVAYSTRLLTAMGLERVTAHPGYQLRVQTLGALRLWRGESEVAPQEWTRRKARQLFQLLLTNRGRMLKRDQLLETLWSKESIETAARDLRVTLNALNRVLEPERGADDPPAFIVRDGADYGLSTVADLWIDADEFSRLIAESERAAADAGSALLHRALGLYNGDYLPDARYEDWASAERERLLALYLHAADRLAHELYARGDDASQDAALGWCERILARDRCWEGAYCLTMRIHAQRGDRVQVRRVFEQCTRTLRDDLDLEPSAATVEVFQQALSESPRRSSL